LIGSDAWRGALVGLASGGCVPGEVGTREVSLA